MLIDFFYTLRAAKVPVSVREYLTLLEALQANVVGPTSDACSMDDFYHLSRTVLVKDEKHFDKFDKAFGAYFKGVEMLTDFTKEVPLDWLEQILKKELTPEQKAAIEKMGWDELMETLKKRLEEQKERHEGGNKWIGTGGTSPFGHGGYNPQGIRIGGAGKNRSAGYLDIKMVPERHNNVKVLLLMDVGGTMDDHIQRVEELFSAVKTEFKHLEFYYFHNCVYDFLWKNNRRRFAEKFPTWDIIRKYNRDYKLIFVGDATMSPYEILQHGGCVEYNNEEAGAEWIQRLTHAFPKFAWINPEPQGVWQYRQSISIVQQLLGNRMFPLSLKGLEETMRLLSK